MTNDKPTGVVREARILAMDLRGLASDVERGVSTPREATAALAELGSGTLAVSCSSGSTDAHADGLLAVASYIFGAVAEAMACLEEGADPVAIDDAALSAADRLDLIA